jgi:membrane fusion protein YbhG
VAAVRVAEGDRVTAGQALVELETELLDAQLAEQQARLAEAEAALARAERGPRSEEIERARIDLAAARTDRERFQALYDAGIVPRRDLDAALVREASARQVWLERERGSRSEDIAAARAARDREAQRLTYLRRQTEELVVRAPAAGVVETLELRPGDLVAASAPVARLLEPDQLWVRVYVPEPRLGAVRVGQRAAVRVDTFPGRDFPGRVVEIRDQGEYTPRNVQTLEQRFDLVFGVKVAIDPTPELKAGMAAFVRLLDQGVPPAAGPAAG